MPIIAAAVAAAALATQPSPPIETTLRAAQGDHGVLVSLTALAEINSSTPTPLQSVDISTGAVRLVSTDHARETGIRTLSVSKAVGSISQAVSHVSVQLALIPR